MRIVSLLPAATEMAFLLGLGDAVVGISHECDHPPQCRGRPVVVHPALQLQGLGMREIDAAVAGRVATGGSLYRIDAPLLRELRPSLLLTQDLCQVCAASGEDLDGVLRTLSPAPEVLGMSPRRLDDVFETLRALGRATGRSAAAAAFVEQAQARFARVAAALAGIEHRPRVFFMEWTDPLYCAGHWVAEMIERAGGDDALARPGSDSVRIAWSEVLRWAPEVLIVAPCGLGLAAARELAGALARLPGWSELPAVRAGRVFGVDANAYFARPGPRLVDGVELLGHILHPQRVSWRGSGECFARLCSEAE